MSNRNFNKQTTNARQSFASGSTVKKLTSKLPKPTGRSNPPKDYKKSTSKELKAMEGFRKVSPKPLDNIRSKGDKMKEQLIGSKEIRDKLRKKKSDMRKKQQADYMKKHGKNEPRRKTLSVKNTYKKEVEGLKK